MADYPRATIRHDMLMERTGELIDAVAVLRVVEDHNRRESLQWLFENNVERIAHFKQRIIERGMCSRIMPNTEMNNDNSPPHLTEPNEDDFYSEPEGSFTPILFIGVCFLLLALIFFASTV